jgi:perosamine synthetase
MNIRLFQPELGESELNAIKNCFDKSWVGLGQKVNEFENNWKQYLGCNECFGLNSATAALHLALNVFKFEKGKKVLVPALTFAATATAVLYNELIPVFVDSNPITLGIDFDDLKNKYDSECVAIIVVHYAGHPVEMEKIIQWANEKKLKVIEDCAHTTGSKYKGTNLGLWGDISCFSFEEKKLMTTGDGGMICSQNAELLKDIKALRWVGIDKDNWKSAQSYLDKNIDSMHWFYEINLLGYKYNMNDLAASIGIEQLNKLENMNAARSKIIERYIERLNNNSKVELLLPYDTSKYVYQMFGIRVNNKTELMIKLKNSGIATGTHYTPLHIQPLFKKYYNNCNYIKEEINRCITLPLHTKLKSEEIDYICDVINENT